MKRRNFLKTAAQATTALPIMLGGMPLRSLGKTPLRNILAQSASANDKILVIVQLMGGNDGLNCVVPYEDTLYRQYRPTLGLDKTANNLRVLSDHPSLAFTNEMSGMHQLYTNGKMAILQNVGYQNPDLSHFRGTDIWNTGTDANKFMHTGWVGRMLGILNPDYPPTTIPKGSFPLALQFGSSLSNLFYADNGGMAAVIGQLPDEGSQSVHFYDPIPDNPTIPYQELDFVRTVEKETEVYTQSIIDRKVKTNKVTYPTTGSGRLGPQLAGVAQLIASGFTTKVYLVMQNGYDTHSNQANDHPNLLQELSDSIKAFQDDIEALGVADKVALMTYSEFGRRPLENGGGTDHGTAAPLFVVGTKVIPGVRGSDPKLQSQNLLNGNLMYEERHDFRNVYATMMTEWLLEGDTSEVDAFVKEVLTSRGSEVYSGKSDWVRLGIFTQEPKDVSTEFTPGLMLMENYPNPVRSETTISFAVPDNMDVTMSIYNMQGIEVARPIDGRVTVGANSVVVNTSKLPAGIYQYQLQTPKGNLTKRMVVVK